MLELEVTLPRENSKRTNQRLLSVMLELLVPYKTLLGVTQVTTREKKKADSYACSKLPCQEEDRWRGWGRGRERTKIKNHITQ